MPSKSIKWSSIRLCGTRFSSNQRRLSIYERFVCWRGPISLVAYDLASRYTRTRHDPKFMNPAVPRIVVIPRITQPACKSLGGSFVLGWHKIFEWLINTMNGFLNQLRRKNQTHGHTCFQQTIFGESLHNLQHSNQMEVSWNGGTPQVIYLKWGFSSINHPFWGTLWKTNITIEHHHF